jgi:signal transduction histidine kinase
MNYVIRIIIFIGVIFSFIMQTQISFAELFFVLVLAGINIFKERYKNAKTILLLELIIVTVACTYSKNFILLYGILAYDIGVLKLYYAYLPIAVLLIYFSSTNNVSQNFIITAVCFMYGHLNCNFHERVSSFREIYDNERRYRYELEDTKERLLNAAKETAHIAEIKERNRIAREIHDTVGHSIAGILMQLQVVDKLMKKDEQKSEQLLKNSIESLSETLNLMRDTVHNIKPNDAMGSDYIKRIVDNFTFCPIDFKFNGDFDSLPPNIIEVISSNIKESLTNTTKYSKASKVDISIDINEKYVRTCIKDDGQGVPKLKEGFGLSGMRERIRNLNGSISINGENGFIIVFIIPLSSEFAVVNN